MFLNNLIILILFNEFSNVLIFLLCVCLLCFVRLRLISSWTGGLQVQVHVILMFAYNSSLKKKNQNETKWDAFRAKERGMLNKGRVRSIDHWSKMAVSHRMWRQENSKLCGSFAQAHSLTHWEATSKNRDENETPSDLIANLSPLWLLQPTSSGW